MKLTDAQLAEAAIKTSEALQPDVMKKVSPEIKLLVMSSMRAGLKAGRALEQKRILEILRSKEALTDRRKYLMQHGTKNTNEFWADWLEKRLDKDTK